MYAVPENCVITYDSNFLQEHVDSSDFEEPRSPIVDIKKGNHSLVKPKKKKMSRRHYPQYETIMEFNQTSATHLYIDCDEYPVKLKPENIPINPKETKKIHKKKPEKKSRTKSKDLSQMNRGDQIAPIQSKLSIFRQKVIPCISSIFKRHYCTNPNMTIIDEDKNEIKNCENRCTYCKNCEQRHVLRLYKRHQNYIVQPVYAIEGNAHKTRAGPFAPTKVVEQPPLRHHDRKTKNQYSSYCNLSSSSESDTRCTQDRQQKVEMFRKRLKDEIMNEHTKYQQNHPIRTQQVQYPSKDKFHVFSTPLQSRQMKDYYDPCLNKFPSSTSSFWEYLYDKTNACSRKYQTHRAFVAQCCDCTPNAQQHDMSSGRSNCCIKQPQPSTGVASYGDINGNGREKFACTCTCKKALQQQTPPLPQKRSCDPLCLPPSSPGLGNPKSSYSEFQKDNSPEKISNASDSKKKKNKVKCQCPEKKKLPDMREDPRNSLERYQAPQRQQGTQELAKTTGGNQGTAVRPCQEGHDEIISSLAQKYNGEILCIHNPPCILINGCLNLPPQKDQKQQNNDMSFWPVTEDRNNNFYYQTGIMNREQSCQYHVEIDKATDYRAEKKMQSICHHKPPCEVVRGCHRAKYDPQLDNSCVHVPMCKQIPECVVTDRRKASCNHRPKCRDIPICSRDFVVLTAKETIGTQVKTSVLSTEKNSFICRHEPPCIMIPKCIGRAMCDSSYVNVDAIPGCIHQPPCELIPACCRKSAKEMVSVSSQYPNSCRIV